MYLRHPFWGSARRAYPRRISVRPFRAMISACPKGAMEISRGVDAARQPTERFPELMTPLDGKKLKIGFDRV